MKSLFLSFLLCVPAHGAAVWSIAQIGDIHAGNGLGTSNDWWVCKNFINNQTNDGVFNIRVVLSPGDMYEQDSFTPLWTNVVDAFTAFRDLGILAIPGSGNHDCDDPTGASHGSRACDEGNEWDKYFPTNWFTYPGYKGTRLDRDTKNVAVTWTNQNRKFLFFTMHWPTNMTEFPPYDIKTAFADQILWATNLLAQYPDHHAIGQVHYMIATNGQFETRYDTGLTLYSNIGLARFAFISGFENSSNLLMLCSGHNRVPLKIHKFFKSPSGDWGIVHQWNSQNYTNYSQMISLITFNEDDRRIYFRSYDIETGTFMTNGQIHYFGLTPRAHTHVWSMPMPGQRSRYKFARILQ